MNEMMKKIIPTMLAASACFLSLTATASPLNYNYLDGGLYFGEGDEYDFAYSIDGSYAVNEHFFVKGSYENVEGGKQVISDGINAFEADVSASQTKLGGGFIWPVGESTDLTLGASWVRMGVELDALGFSHSSNADGYGIELGARHQFASGVEMFGNISNDHVEDFKQTYFELGGRYQFTDNLSGGLSYVADTEDTSGGVYRSSIRFSAY